MDKYRRLRKPAEKTAPFEVRVTGQTLLRNSLGYVAHLFEDKNEKVVIKGMGFVISKAISLATLIRRRFKGLHQLVDFGTLEIVDEYDPIEEGLDHVVVKKKVANVAITLSLAPLDKNHPGYAAPLPDSEVSEYEPFGGRSEGFRSRGFRGRGFRGRRPRREGYEGGYYGEDYPAEGEEEGYGTSRGRGRGRGRFGPRGPRRYRAPRSDRGYYEDSGYGRSEEGGHRYEGRGYEGHEEGEHEYGRRPRRSSRYGGPRGGRRYEGEGYGRREEGQSYGRHYEDEGYGQPRRRGRRGPRPYYE